MLEPLTLALLALPGDPGDVFGPVLKHPETLLAKGGRGGGGRGAGGRAGVKLSRAGETLESGKLARALKGRKLRWYHSGRERKRLLLLYRKVRAYYVMSFLCKVLAAPVMFLTLVAFLGLAHVLEREDVPSACSHALIAAFFLVQFGIGAEVAESEQAVEAFSDAVLAGKSPKDCLHAFREHGIYNVKIVLTVYSALSALLVLALTWTLRGRVSARTLLLASLTTTAILIAPVIMGLWILKWGAWVVR
ncbi:MAG: hypothetical protein ABGY09_04070 [Euryarchaeota archaeon]